MATAKRLHPESVFSSEEEGIRAFDESEEGFWRTIGASLISKA